MTPLRNGLVRKWSGLYYGWRMMALVSAFRTLGGGLHSYGFTVFFLPISNELGIGRAATALVFSLSRAEGAIEGPLAGYLTDRFGPRPIMLTAAVLCGIGYILLSQIESYTGFLVIYLGIISLIFTPGFVLAPSVLANSWFIRYRARALLCLSAAMPVGGAVLTPLLAIAVDAWGWRQAAILSGCFFLLVSAPLTLKIRRSPESMGLHPDGREPDPDLTPDGLTKGLQNQPQIAVTDVSARRAMKGPLYWILVLWMTIRTAAYGMVTVHFVPLMVWKGLTQEHAALLLGGFALMNLVAHFVLGWIADQQNKPRLITICMLLALLSVLPLIWTNALWALWIFASLFTLVDAAIPVMWATVGDFFGRKSFGSIRGTMSFFYMWGSFIGPVFAGAAYDRDHTYTLVIWALLALLLAATVIPALLITPWARLQKRG